MVTKGTEEVTVMKTVLFHCNRTQVTVSVTGGGCIVTETTGVTVVETVLLLCNRVQKLRGPQFDSRTSETS